MNISNIISLLTLGGNLIIAYYINRKINNRRKIKDYFMDEIIVQRNAFRRLEDELIDQAKKPLDLKMRIHVLISRVNDLMNAASVQFGINENDLSAYVNGFYAIIDEDLDYTANYSKNSEFHITSETKRKLKSFDSQNDHKFTDVIVYINNK